MLLTKYENNGDKILKLNMMFILVIAFQFVNGNSEIRISTPNKGNVDAELIPTVYNYYTKLSTLGLSGISGTSITFQIKACSDSSVLLSVTEDLISPDFYEIFIGGSENRRIFFSRKYGPNDANAAASVLDCASFKPLWISWTNGRIRVGIGSIVDQNGVFDWTDANPFKIKGIGVMSSWGSSAEWIFPFSGISFLSDTFKDMFFCASVGYKFLNPAQTDLNTTELECGLWCARGDDCQGFNYNKQTDAFNGVFFCASAEYTFSNPAIKDQSNTTEIECGLWCAVGNNCQGFTYNKQSGNCQTVSNNEVLQPVVDINQELYIPCWRI